ncbi:protein kinase [Gemmata sp. JC673]|uniref:Protein kinase n=1 Tax=Gemmata algarum TaxID=2975278 RepID=A0ABU5ETE3_9BACT|nr:protein kinase [Gemmata algarum]MDY3557892.1 protein kinase [Gemmata algarum]
MPLETADDLVRTLQGSGLFTPEQIGAIVRDLNAFGTDLQGGMRHILKHERVTHYQLGKIIRGKSADLVVGSYIVLDKLGEGGMGKVFRARHGRTDRTVALKVIRPSLIVNPTVRGRYAREVQATGKLHHPNIVSVDDAGEADGKFFLAMEFVDGIDLARMMRDFQKLEVVEACEYVRQAALGLQHAHDHGLVHRDIKPSNIVVAGERHLPQATEPAVVKILDLGLARAVDPEDMVAPDLTRDHTVVGTPDYMAPEQAKNSKLVDARADLYSLGCTLYFLLTGRPPFPTGNAIEKLLQHQLERPAPLQALRPGVPAPVAEIVARLMAKRPDDRFQTAAEVAAILESYARYPDGSAAVPVVTVRPAPQNPAASGDTLPSRSTALPSSMGLVPSSTTKHVLLDLPENPPALQPAATSSDVTPRPVDLAELTTKPRRGKRRQAPASRSNRARPRPSRNGLAPVWVGAGVMTLVLLVVLVWAVRAVNSRLAPTPQPTPQMSPR